ncbi:MAG: phage terminase large subunit [Pseudomonadota bacterium]
MNLQFPDVFRPLVAPARYKGAWGGRGSGKSHFFGGMLCLRALKQRTRAVCLREVQNSIKDSVKQLFQLFFVIPLGVWFAAVVADSLFHFTWNVAALPPPLDTWAGWIVSALFLVDGGKVLLRRNAK